jgi:hypothetical protein
MNAFNVVRVGCGSDAYRSAVETIIRDIQRAHTRDGKPLPLEFIADSIEASLGTISNAVNQKASLSAEYLARLGSVYGAAFLNPYFALMGAQAAPLDAATRDVLPLLTMAAHTLACARDPQSPGGTVEVPQEKAAMLRPFKELHRELSGQIVHIEAVLA